jgi:bifunctional oligoribonuclease and PAP phosphatase NrnA
VVKVKDLSKYTKEISELISSTDNILLICHINPDGDAVGAQLAMYYYLKAAGKNVSMISPNYLQEFLKWMEGTEEINIFIKDRKKCMNLINEAGIIILLDFNKPNRLGEAEQFVMSANAPKVIIDHHLDPDNLGSLVISEPTFCATAELVWELIREIEGKPFASPPFAEAVYTGIITDTGNFVHGSYTPDTMRIIAELLEQGVEKDRILNLIYNNYSADRMRLQGFALYERMVVLPEFKTAYIYLSREDLKRFNHVKGDTEGFVNMPLSINGIIFTAMFIEKEGFIKLSFRSKGKFPSNEIASQYFHGGGHRNASGGEFPDTLDNTIGYFLNILKENAWRFKDNL